MKSKSFVIVFAPVMVTLIAAGLMMLDNLVPGIVSTWMLWEVVLVSTIATFMAVAALCAIWFVQWLAVRLSEDDELVETKAEVLQLNPPRTAATVTEEIEHLLAVGEK
jgi:hypothetical protein